MVDWEWYKNANCSRLFIHCLLKANYEDKKWQGIIIPKGSFVTSIKQLSSELGISEQQIRTALKKLKSTNEITCTSTNKYTMICVVNYGRYQTPRGDEQHTNQHANQQSNNKQITFNQQQLINITNKQDNKDNDKDKDKRADALVSLNYFTNLLIKKGFLLESEQELILYNNLFNDLLNKYEFVDIAVAVEFVSNAMKNKDIKNKYWYFKKSVEKQLDPFRRLNQESNAVEPIADDTNISDQELRELLKDI